MAERYRKISKNERKKKFKSENRFVHNAFFLFNKANEIVSELKESKTSLKHDTSVNLKEILDKMLHSILFLANIHIAQYSPDDIFAEKEILLKTKEDFPKPFAHYQTHVAKQTPFSYFVELVTIFCGQNNEDKVKKMLSDIYEELCEKTRKRRITDQPLISSVICICKNSAFRYYGVSLSCESEQARKIMTAVSCLHVWHPKVSTAVMSVFPVDNGECSIKLPFSETEWCRAYAVQDMNLIKPCSRCSQLYSLPYTNDKSPRNPAGKCAETEAISNLLRKEADVSDKTTINGAVYNEQEIKQKCTECFGKSTKYDINKYYPYSI